MPELKVSRWQEPGPPDPDAATAVLAAEGLRARVAQERAGAFYAEHHHSYDETRWILSGRLLLTSGGREILLSPGDRIDIPAGIRHQIRVPRDEPVVYLVATRRVAR